MTENANDKRKKRKLKQKGLRRIRFYMMPPFLIHYGSVFIKSGKFPFLVKAHEWLLTYIYNGAAGSVLRPVCEMVWGHPWYPKVYLWTGRPLLIAVILLSYLIFLKERTDEVKPFSIQFYDVFSGGRYYSVKPSLFRKIKSFLILKFFGEQNNLCKEAEESHVVTMISDDEERTLNLGQLGAGRWGEKNLRVSFAAKEHQVRVEYLVDDEVWLLDRGEYCKIRDVYVTYLA